MTKLIKTYCVDKTELSTIFNVQGKAFRVHFTGGFQSGNCYRRASYTTDNPIIQKAIEDDPRYLDIINISRVDKVKEKKPSVNKQGKYKSYNLVTSIQDARNILITHHKVDPAKLGNSLSEVNKAAESVNVKFPRLR